MIDASNSLEIGLKLYPTPFPLNGYQPHVTCHVHYMWEYIIPLRLCFVQAFNVGESEKYKVSKALKWYYFIAS